MSDANAWQEAGREIIDKLNVAEEARALGVRFVSDARKANGWMDCHSPFREDARPSAGIYVGDGKKRGLFKDFAGECMRFFDWTARLLSLPDWKAARNYYADKLGIKLPNSRPPETLEDKLAWLDWDETVVRIWCELKGGISVEAVKMAGGRLAANPKKAKAEHQQYVIAFPVYGPDFLEDDPSGWALVRTDGADMEIGYGENMRTDKTMLVKGSKSGLMNSFGLHRLEAAELIFKVEGITDMLAMQSIIPAELRERHVVITNSCGALERIKAEWLKRFAGKKVVVIHDADDPGEIGARHWVNDLLPVASEARHVQLPYEITVNHGADLRDWIKEGHSYDDLMAMVDAVSPAAKAGSKPAGPAAKAMCTSDTGVPERVPGRSEFEVLARQIFVIRQKHDKTDLRREHEINAEVAGVIKHDLHERAKFFHDLGQGYFFVTGEKKLISLADDDGELTLFLARYGLNPSEKIHKYVVEALRIEALTKGTATRVHRFAFFDRSTFTLYVYNHGQQVYRITADAIELVDNGTEGVMFLHQRSSEPYRFLADADPEDDVFEKLIVSRPNFVADGRLTVDVQQMLYAFWIFSTFFGTIFPTKAILAFIGEKGSGKSAELRKLGIVFFGSQFQVSELPPDAKDYDAIVTNAHFAAFDNCDSKVDWLPDRLAVCATGGNVTRRKYYTTNTLVEFRIDAFLGLNARTPYFGRDDVVDRLLLFRVKRFDKGTFVAESTLLAEVLKNRDAIMTALLRRLQMVVRAMQATEGRPYTSGLRMADFATFCLRIADASDNKQVVEDAFRQLASDQNAFALENDSLVELLRLWIMGNQGKEVDATTLYGELSSLARCANMGFDYRSSRSLAIRLANIETNLRQLIDVKVRTDTHRNLKMYQFWPITDQKGLQGGPSVNGNGHLRTETVDTFDDI